MIIKFLKKLFSVMLILLLIVGCIYVSNIYKNYHHNQVKDNVLEQIQKQIDQNPMEVSYKTNEYKIDGECYRGNIYVVNNVKDLKFVKDLLNKCKPLWETINYEPTNIHVFIGNVNIGYTGGSGHYYWSSPTQSGKTVGFELASKYDDKLWEFLDSMDYIEGQCD